MRNGLTKASILFLSTVILSSCGVTSLYYWGGTKRDATAYEQLAYADYKNQSPEAVCNLICVYEDMVSNPGGTRQVPPPGICAEYGYILLQPQTAKIFYEHATGAQKRIFSGSDYSALFSERGKLMLQKEMEYYPESRQFIEPLIKRLVQ